MMKKLFSQLLVFSVITILFSSSALAQSNAIPMTITPVPVECELSMYDYIPLSRITISTNDDSAIKWANKHLALWYKKFAPKVIQKRYTGNFTHDGAYSINISQNGVEICAKNIIGVRYALYSLRQIAIANRDTEKLTHYIVPVGSINDYPAMEFRGMHLCWFPETQEYEIERMIRMAAYYKFNYVVLEPWGTYQSKTAPWLNWKNPPMTKKCIKRLVAIAKDLGVTLIPQINIFGHASYSRSMSGKHSTLDLNPQYQPLFEPMAGWNWCLSNPATKKVLADYMVEMLEDFGNPKFFHIGCDEANKPSCPTCTAQSYSNLFVEHIKFAHKVLAEHGARLMMWQDMLLEKGDKRWKGCTISNGTPETAKAAESLPKDIVICDWYYGDGRKNYPSYSYFQSLGYDVLATSWKNVSGILAEAKAIQKINALGVLGTTWHKYYGYDLATIYTNTAHSTWNPAANKWQKSGFNVFKTHLRQVSWDMKIKKYEYFGINLYQIPGRIVEK
jgi:hypothetical protein